MQGTKPKQLGPQNLKIGVRETTMKKFKRIAKLNRWTLVETADAVADAYLKSLSGPNVIGNEQQDVASAAA